MIGRPRVMLTPERSSHLAGRRIDLEAEQLHRDMHLVMVHGDHCVVLAGAQLDKDRIARDRPRHVQTVRHSFGDSRLGDVDVLPAEQAAFARMGIERRHGNTERAARRA